MLVTKSLQTLANLTVFGAKETWMTPMNSFCTSHREQFKEFIDSICDISPEVEPGETSIALESHLNFLQQLSFASRQGSLSVPSLIDAPRNLAALMDMWLDKSESQNRDGMSSLSEHLEGDLATFHNLCTRLRNKTNTYKQHLDTTIEWTNSLYPRWALVAEEMEAKPTEFWIQGRPPTAPSSRAEGGRETATPNNALPRPIRSAFGLKGPRVTSKPVTEEKDRSAKRHSGLTTISDSSKTYVGSDRRKSEDSGSGSTGSGKTKRSGRKPSPQRTVEDNALRKLGWM